MWKGRILTSGKEAIHTRRGKLDPYKETTDEWLTEDLKARPQKGILQNLSTKERIIS